MKVANSVVDLIGNTPLVRLNNLTKGIDAHVFVKLESANPGGSVKDRLGLALIEDAEKRGILKPGGTIIEPSSGNTGIGLAMVSAVKGYKVIIVMPESASIERRKLMEGLGAQVILTPATEGMKGAISKANALLEDIDGSFMPMQFENPANIEFHKRTTAVEIWNDTDGTIDFFVSGVGTGGTFSGVSTVLKEKKPSVTNVAVEPKDSPVLSGGEPGSHKIQGIGAGFIPQNCKTELIDEIVPVSNENAFETARRLMKEEGIICGISSGAIVWAALSLASLPENKGKTFVAIVCDTGERYLSTSLFHE
ncbi:cysteine synthase A [Saccharicrinis sp. FJH54]|uniref:cysteine synthase A n=1 Tax=Saccharicrinis sp. FJH54 TaxID=3344665 RepID=UPI0035D4997F